MKDFLEDLWRNFIKPFFFVLIVIAIICWVMVYSYLLYYGRLKWFDIFGFLFIASEAIIAFFYERSKLIRRLEPIVFSDRFFEVTLYVVTFSNLMHLDAAWPLFCYILRTRGVVLVLAFLGFGIYNYFTIPKD